MELASIWTLVALSALSAVGAVAFQSPVRAAASFLVALVFIATLLLSLDRPAMAGLVLWVSGGGAGLVLLVTVLLLNLSPEEAGSRRFSLPRLLSLFIVGYLGTALVGVVSGASLPLVERPLGKRSLDEVALGASLFDSETALVGCAFLGLCAVMWVALVMARRRM